MDNKEQKSLKQIIEYRIKKIAELKDNNINPYPYKFNKEFDVSYILNNEKKLIPEINSEVAQKMLKEGEISGGMIPKINTCIDAVNNGVTGVVIVDGRKHHSILFELFSDKGAGTLIRK